MSPFYTLRATINRQVVDVYLFSSKDAVENRFGCSPSAYINDMLGVYA